jgi:pyruvate/2-oxoglutarate dehydrogenase complex dihydrolipoamide acyltransferase (E2) component
MKESFRFRDIPRSRVATFDTFAVGLSKHHVSALLEFDVTVSRKRIHGLRKDGHNISFNGWLIKVIGDTLCRHPEASAYLYSKKKLIIFDDINISVMAEKVINGQKVPMPVLIEKVQEKSVREITEEISRAREQEVSDTGFVINKAASFSERIYYRLPGWCRRMVWRMMLRSPGFAYRKMGNAVITSVGMIGRINGWFIHRSVHPVSFGVGSVIRKPVVINNEVMIREILNMTVLADHDVIDGAPMVRFLNELTRAIESGACLAG